MDTKLTLRLNKDVIEKTKDGSNVATTIDLNAR